MPSCPSVAIIATLILVAGGAANSVSSFSSMNFVTAAITASCLLPIIGGGLALLFTHFTSISEPSKRAVVVETLSKSPTLAYVLARKHFGVFRHRLYCPHGLI